MGIEWPELTKLSGTYCPPKNALPPPSEKNVPSSTPAGEHLPDKEFYAQFASKESKPIDYLKAVYEERINSNLPIINDMIAKIKERALQAALNKWRALHFHIQYPSGTLSSIEEAVHLNHKISEELRKQGFAVSLSPYCAYESSGWWSKTYYHIEGDISGWDCNG